MNTSHHSTTPTTPNTPNTSQSKYIVLLVSSILVTYAVVGGMIGLVGAQGQTPTQAKYGSLPQLEYFSEVLGKVRSDYVDEPAMGNTLSGAIRGLIESVDPAGAYLTPTDVAFYKDYDAEKAQGIGAFLVKRSGYPMVVSSVAGGPAAKAGLGTGDIIESIEGMTTREMNMVQIEELLSRPAGKPVSLSVIRRSRVSNDPEKMSVNREAFHVPGVESKMIESNIAYVRVPYLGPGKASDARKQLEGLLKKGATSILLDLRNTAGSNEQEAIDLASIFLDSGVSVGSLQGQKVAKKTLTAGPSAAVTKAPLSVLINLGTMGNAELVAAAIGDAKRGQLVGTRTWGAASVQKLLPMADGFGLLLSTAKYSTPSGKEIQDVGVRPNVESLGGSDLALSVNPDELEDLPPGKPAGKGASTPAKAVEDPQLKKAIETLRNPAGTRGE